MEARVTRALWSLQKFAILDDARNLIRLSVEIAMVLGCGTLFDASAALVPYGGERRSECACGRIVAWIKMLCSDGVMTIIVWTVDPLNRLEVTLDMTDEYVGVLQL